MAACFRELLTKIAILLFAFCGVTVSATGSTRAQIEKVDPAKQVLKPLSLQGVSNALVHGKFDEDGLYAAIGKMEPGTLFPSHKHPDTRISIVLRGTMILGQGSPDNPSQEQRYGVGTFAITPANTVHYMRAGSESVLILEVGSGPSGMSFTKGKTP